MFEHAQQRVGHGVAGGDGQDGRGGDASHGRVGGDLTGGHPGPEVVVGDDGDRGVLPHQGAGRCAGSDEPGDLTDRIVRAAPHDRAHDLGERPAGAQNRADPFACAKLDHGRVLPMRQDTAWRPMISTVDLARGSMGPDGPGPRALPPHRARTETGGAGGEWDEHDAYATSGGRRGRLAVGPGGAAVRGRTRRAGAASVLRAIRAWQFAMPWYEQDAGQYRAAMVDAAAMAMRDRLPAGHGRPAEGHRRRGPGDRGTGRPGAGGPGRSGWRPAGRRASGFRWWLARAPAPGPALLPAWSGQTSTVYGARRARSSRSARRCWPGTAAAAWPGTWSAPPRRCSATPPRARRPDDRRSRPRRSRCSRSGCTAGAVRAW